MKRVLHVEVSSLFEGIGFESMVELLGTFTPKRWELIQRLKREGPLTPYALAKALGRDYKNVRLDANYPSLKEEACNCAPPILMGSLHATLVIAGLFLCLALYKIIKLNYYVILTTQER